MTGSTVWQKHSLENETEDSHLLHWPLYYQLRSTTTYPVISHWAYHVNWISVVFQQSSWHCPFKGGIYDNDVEKAHINPSESGGGCTICSCYWSERRGYACQVTATYLHDIDGWASSWPPTSLRNGPCSSSFRSNRLWETVFLCGNTGNGSEQFC